jgi:hypothetical protein
MARSTITRRKIGEVISRMIREIAWSKKGLMVVWYIVGGKISEINLTPPSPRLRAGKAAFA